ncbi:MAG: stage III sporulation protein AD [Lachnospiraceae bacterium]|nr:stage III sporulation protein AD [Lachnospiraceae bacterium]
MELSIVQLALLAVIGMLIALLCKKHQAEVSTIISLGICLILMFFMVQAFDELVAFVQQIAGIMNLEYVGVLLKLIGIAYICEFAASLCKDAGYQAISGQIEMAGRIAMMIISLPVIQSIINTISAFMS